MRRTKRTRRTRRKKQRGGSTIPICIYSHSEYFDILQIQFDYLTKLFKGTGQPIYLFADKNYDKQMELTYKTILYDGNAPYMQRLATCIEQVPEPYFILSQDNDILIKYDAQTISKLMASMKEHAIDSIELKHNEKNKEPKIKVTDTLSIVRHGKEDPYTFCVQPHLWEKGAAKEFYTTNTIKGYRESENNNVQRFAKEHQVTYELFSEKSLQSTCIGKAGKVSPEYVFIHVTNSGKFIHNGNIEKSIVDPLVQAEIDVLDTPVVVTPEGQEVHDVAPAEDEYWPTGHDIHVVAPAVDEY